MKNSIIHPSLKPALSLLIAVALIIIMQGVATAQTPPANPAGGSTLEQRVAQRKAERALKLEQKDIQRITAQCVAAQGKVRSLQQQTTAAINNRNTKYQQMDAKLWVAIGKLKLSGKDTFNLEKQRTVLADKTAAFQTTANNYRQTLDDMLLINCGVDPAGFKSLLETARIYRTQLRDGATAIKAHITDGVKPLLSSFATELQPKPATETNP